MHLLRRVVAGLCDAVQENTGLVAAIAMGFVLANMRDVVVDEDRPLLKTIVQLTFGVLFISVSATVTAGSLRGVVWPENDAVCMCAGTPLPARDWLNSR